MALQILISIFFTAVIFGCNSNSNQKDSFDTTQKATEVSDTINKTLSSVTSKYTMDEYAFIVGIIQKGDSTFINADYIQYLTGKAAVKAAIKEHQADTFKTEDGKIHIDVPNDYFIINDNKKIRKLKLDKNCLIDLVINPDRMPSINENSFKSLKNVDHESPFILTLNAEGLVIIIKEIFVP